MRKLVLVLALISKIAVAQETAQPTTIKEDKILLVSDALTPYVKAYLNAFRANGWNFKRQLNDGDFVVVFDKEIKQDLNEFNEGEGAAGIALGMNENESVYVVINIEVWVKLKDYEKQDLINHELSHDIFNQVHVANDEDDLMHPSSYPKDWGHTTSRLIGLITKLNKQLDE